MMKIHVRSLSRRLKDGTVVIQADIKGKAPIVLVIDPHSWMKITVFAAREACVAPTIKSIIEDDRRADKTARQPED